MVPFQVPAGASSAVVILIIHSRTMWKRPAGMMMTRPLVRNSLCIMFLATALHYLSPHFPDDIEMSAVSHEQVAATAINMMDPLPVVKQQGYLRSAPDIVDLGGYIRDIS